MRLPPTLASLLSLAVVALFGGARLHADVVETKNGARLVGKVTKIDAGSVYLTTEYAGDLVIRQPDVAAITTDGPVAVRLASGTRLDGKVTQAPDGAVQIAGADGTLSTSVDRIAASWPVDGEDPAVAALQRHWTYEATVDINGTSGNSDQLGTGAGFRAKLVSPQDTLQFYSGYNRQVSDGKKSADQFKAGVDYASYFEDRSTWFLRDEAGFDRIMDVRFYDTAAAGYGYAFIKNPVDTLTARVGLAYRYDGYDNPATATVNSAAADFEIAHDLKLANWELNNALTIVPSFQDTRDVIVTQDSFWQVPLASPVWKLRMGVSNDYNSEPGRGIKRLDTSYYTRLILDWN